MIKTTLDIVSRVQCLQRKGDAILQTVEGRGVETVEGDLQLARQDNKKLAHDLDARIQQVYARHQL